MLVEEIVRGGLACRDMFIASRAGLDALAEGVEAKQHACLGTYPMPSLDSWETAEMAMVGLARDADAYLNMDWQL